jgi:hypothetical protein
MKSMSIKMKQLGSIVTVVVLSAYSLVSSAGPDKTTKLLMDTPASVVDLGQIRLDTYLTRAFKNTESQMIVNVSYSWDDDKIEVGLAQLDFKGTKSAARNACLKGFATLRLGAGVDIGTSKIHDFLPMSYWEEKFVHVNYDQGGLQRNIKGKLDKKFVLSCTIWSEDYSRVLKITSPLLSTSYSEVSD